MFQNYLEVPKITNSASYNAHGQQKRELQSIQRLTTLLMLYRL